MDYDRKGLAGLESEVRKAVDTFKRYGDRSMDQILTVFFGAEDDNLNSGKNGFLIMTGLNVYPTLKICLSLLIKGRVFLNYRTSPRNSRQ